MNTGSDGEKASAAELASLDISRSVADHNRAARAAIRRPVLLRRALPRHLDQAVPVGVVRPVAADVKIEEPHQAERAEFHLGVGRTLPVTTV